MNELESIFDILSKKLPDYETRPQQLEMANKVYACLKEGKNLIVEAGTGVGKSFAYLIPAILLKKKTVVSTATITLQDQLVNKDIVFLQNVLPQRFSFAILKGKNNYLCLKRHKEFSELGENYQRFNKWTITTKTGDKDELPFIPNFWSRVCGNTDDCNSRECPFFSECFYYKHYRQLHKKDILVINHHILIYDLLSDFSLIPFHEQLIIDEAHEIEDVISHVFGSILNHSRIIWLLYRLRGLKIAIDHLFGPVDSFFKRANIPSQAVYPIPDAIIDGLKDLRDSLSLSKIVPRLNAYKESVASGELKDRIETTIKYVKSLARDIDDFIEEEDKDRVYYMAVNKGAIELKSNLVESQMPFAELLKGYDSLIMTSATLTTGGNFGFIKERLDIEDFKEILIGSPFDYKKQAILYIDKELPTPDKENEDAFQQKSLMTIEGLINVSMGRALVLFTSYKHLNFVSKNIRIDYPFKSQGDMPPARLINWFKRTSNSVLLATATFWQGIDIKGENLSLVIIVKMPFVSPGDPVYDERCRRLGDRWFTDLALPSAILMLRQGFGRLIRSTEDYGVVAILDKRLVINYYGKIILSSLPEINIVHNIEDVKRFFDSIPKPVFSKKVQIANQMEKISLNDDADNKNISTVVAFGKSDNPSVIPELIDFTKSKNGNIRRLAASALGKLARFKPEIYKAVVTLEELLDDEKPQVRQYALKALAKIGRLDMEKLTSFINNPEEKGYNIALAKRLLRKAE
ncbi:MAG: helicase C-terminal domain-containing protein [Nitrospirota bacterium]